MSDFLKKILGSKTEWMIENGQVNSPSSEQEEGAKGEDEGSAIEEWKSDMQKFFPGANNWAEVEDSVLLRKRVEKENAEVRRASNESRPKFRRPLPEHLTETLLSQNVELQDKLRQSGAAAKPKSKWRLFGR